MRASSTENGSTGRVELICGPMFAGKTTRLISRLSHERVNGKEVVATKPVRDDRYGMSQVVTHDGTRMDAIAIGSMADFDEHTAGADVIGIDELHFFEAQIATVCRDIRNRGKTVIAAGVDLDHRAKPFAAVEAVERIADCVTRVTATCARCGGEARLTQRLIDSDAAIVVGGAGDYEPRCESCFRPELKGQ